MALKPFVLPGAPPFKPLEEILPEPPAPVAENVGCVAPGTEVDVPDTFVPLATPEEFSILAPAVAHDIQLSEPAAPPPEPPHAEHVGPDAGATTPAIGRALFEVLTGAAGSGKSYASKAFVAQAAGSAVLASSTGISAVNLGGEATTINALLGYFDEDSLRDKILQGRVQGMIRKLRTAGVRRIILDEVSMISAEVLDLLVYAVQECNKDLDVVHHPEDHIGMTLVGDFAQLPPVQGKYAFEAGCWEELFAPHIYKLTRIWRQSDPAFVEALRAARRADVPKVVEFFGPGTQLTTDPNYDGITVFGTNAEVARWNDFEHQKLAVRPVVFETKRGGQQKPEWKPPNPNGRGGGHIPDHMGIKPGARVMILANEHDRDAGGLVYSNGDLGTFEGVTEQEMEVGGEYKLVKMAVVRLMRNGEQVGVPEVTRLWETPSGALGVKKPKMDVLGWVRYMPIRLAYASSVHKTQGLSMDKVQVAIAHKFFASPAMLYVALSRARSMAGLRLVGTPQLVANRCTVDPKVKAWL